MKIECIFIHTPIEEIKEYAYFFPEEYKMRRGKIKKKTTMLSSCLQNVGVANVVGIKKKEMADI